MLNDVDKKKTTPQDIIRMALESNAGLINRQHTSSPSSSMPQESGGSYLPAATAPVEVSKLQNLAQNMALTNHNWSGPQWDALFELVQNESGWDPWVRNPNSSAANLFQFLDSTRENYGIPIDAPVEDQIRAGLQYIADRYGDPVRALNHWRSQVPINGRNVGHWY